MNKIVIILLALAALSGASAVVFNYDSAYVGPYNYGPYSGSLGAYENPYTYYGPSLHQRTCLGSGCRAARAYTPRYGFDYDYGRYQYGGRYSSYGYGGAYNSKPVMPAQICKPGGSCRDVGNQFYY